MSEKEDILSIIASLEQQISALKKIQKSLEPIEDNPLKWDVKNLKELDLILALLHSSGHEFEHAIQKSKASSIVGVDVLDASRWQWLQVIISKTSWDMFVTVLAFMKEYPKTKISNLERCEWFADSQVFHAVFYLIRRDEVRLKRYGLVLRADAPFPNFFSYQIIPDVLSEDVRGYFNMRIRMVPCSNQRTNLSSSILDVMASRLDAMVLIYMGRRINP